MRCCCSTSPGQPQNLCAAASCRQHHRPCLRLPAWLTTRQAWCRVPLTITWPPRCSAATRGRSPRCCVAARGVRGGCEGWGDGVRCGGRAHAPGGGGRRALRITPRGPTSCGGGAGGKHLVLGKHAMQQLPACSPNGLRERERERHASRRRLHTCAERRPTSSWASCWALAALAPSTRRH